MDVYSQPGVIRGTLQLPHPVSEVWRSRTAATADGTYNLVAALDDRVIGNIGLTVPRNPRRAHVGYLGMAVHDAWQGQGVGMAMMAAVLALADGWLNLSRLELQVFTDNVPAIRLYRRTGFETEGTLSAYALRAGSLADVYTMARLRRPAGPAAD